MAYKTRGFTLIELMIVIAVIAILVTIGYNTYLDYSREQRLIAAARSVISDLRTAREAAIAGNKPSDCIDPGNPNNDLYFLNSYSFLITPPKTYEVDANCVVNGTKKDSHPKPPTVLPDDITISPDLNTNPISFKPLAQGTNIPSGGTALIVITQTSTGNTQTITVGANGYVQ